MRSEAVKATQENSAPAERRRLRNGRAVNIALRTAHIGVTGVLCGGHVFGISPELLKIWLCAAIATGGLLAVVEAFPHVRWLAEGRGLFVLTKLALLCLIPVLWECRVLILAVVVVLASVGSHMPARFRDYSVWHGRMVDDHQSPRVDPRPTR